MRNRESERVRRKEGKKREVVSETVRDRENRKRRIVREKDIESRSVCETERG